MKNILIVDDNYYFATGLSMNLALCLQDCTVMTARNGMKALEIMKSIRVDCIVTDLGMPSPDGLELAEFLASAYPSLPVFVLTGSGPPDKATGRAARGAFRCVEKGMEFRKLAGFITSELGPLFGNAVTPAAAA